MPIKTTDYSRYRTAESNGVLWSLNRRIPITSQRVKEKAAHQWGFPVVLDEDVTSRIVDALVACGKVKAWPGGRYTRTISWKGVRQIPWDPSLYDHRVVVDVVENRGNDFVLTNLRARLTEGEARQLAAKYASTGTIPAFPDIHKHLRNIWVIQVSSGGPRVVDHYCLPDGRRMERGNSQALPAISGYGLG